LPVATSQQVAVLDVAADGAETVRGYVSFVLHGSDEIPREFALRSSPFLELEAAHVNGIPARFVDSFPSPSVVAPPSTSSKPSAHVPGVPPAEPPPFRLQTWKKWHRETAELVLKGTLVVYTPEEAILQVSSCMRIPPGYNDIVAGLKLEPDQEETDDVRTGWASSVTHAMCMCCAPSSTSPRSLGSDNVPPD
jgi:hypothetical protein